MDTDVFLSPENSDGSWIVRTHGFGKLMDRCSQPFQAGWQHRTKCDFSIMDWLLGQTCLLCNIEGGFDYYYYYYP